MTVSAYSWLRRAVHPPVEEWVDDHRLGHARRRVLVVAAVGIAEVVAEQRLVPLEVAVDGLRVRVHQELVRVAAVPPGRIVWAVHPVAVALAGFDVGDEAVPDEAVDLGQRHPGLGAVGVEQAQLDLLGGLAEHCEIGARAVVGGAERICLARPDLQRRGRRRRFGGLGQSARSRRVLQGDRYGPDATIRGSGGPLVSTGGTRCPTSCQPAELSHAVDHLRPRCGNHHAQPAAAAQRDRRRDARRACRRLPALRPRRLGACDRADRHAARVLRRRRPVRGEQTFAEPGPGFQCGGHRGARVVAVQAGDRGSQRPRARPWA